MWIVYLLSFIAGGVIAWLIDTIVEHLADKENYSKLNFKSRLRGRIFGLVWTSIIVSTLVLISACIVLDRTDKDLRTRVETLEQKMEQYESLNQIDTIVIRRSIDEEDLK